MVNLNETLLDDLLGKLESVRVWSPRVVSKLEVLKIGIHAGHSIVVTLNDRLDYFGQSLNIAFRVQGLAEAGDIYVSEDVFKFPGVQEAVAHFKIAPEKVVVKGVSETIQVYKISAGP